VRAVFRVVIATTKGEQEREGIVKNEKELLYESMEILMDVQELHIRPHNIHKILILHKYAKFIRDFMN
jgi:hypothetical protein